MMPVANPMAEVVGAFRTAIEAVDVTSLSQGAGVATMRFVDLDPEDPNETIGLEHMCYRLDPLGWEVAQRARPTEPLVVSVDVYVASRVRAPSAAGDRMSDLLAGWAVATRLAWAVRSATIDGSAHQVHVERVTHLGALDDSRTIHGWMLSTSVHVHTTWGA